MYMHMVSGESTGSSERSVCGDSIQRVERSEIDAVNISEIAVGSDSDLFAAFVRDVLLEESLIDRVRSPGLSISDDDNYLTVGKSEGSYWSCPRRREISARSRRSEFIGIVKAKGCCSRFEQLGAFDGDSSFLQGRVQAVEVNRCRSEEHTSELQSLMRISYAVFCLKKQKQSLHN